MYTMILNLCFVARCIEMHTCMYNCTYVLGNNPVSTESWIPRVKHDVKCKDNTRVGILMHYLCRKINPRISLVSFTE